MIVGLDMGGTHIDAVIIKDGNILNTVKKLNKSENVFQSIWTALEELLSGYDISKIKRVNLSTTVSTNAIVENKTSRVGMIIQSGPGLPHDFLACGQENAFISGYVDHRGEIVKDLNPNELQDALTLFKEKAIDNCCVVTKFSTRNPQVELKIKSFMEKDFSPITMGHTLSGKLNFPRRVFTSYLNSAVYQTFNNFSDNIKRSLEEKGIKAPIFILKADGGTMDLATAEQKPVETILSGPSASLMGINALLDTKEDALLLDIGGTTTDIFFLAQGSPLFEPLGIKIASYNTLVRSVYSVSIALGGDSCVSIKDGIIKIGPQRKGLPFGLGGPEPTPTDAMITLGMINAYDRERSCSIMGVLGKQLGLSAEDMAKAILSAMADIIKTKVDSLLDEINSQPVYTIKELLHGKKIEPQLINIIGGPAKALKPILSEKFCLPTYYPKNYDIANAIGAALVNPTAEINVHIDTWQGILSVPELGIYEKSNKDYNLNSAKIKAKKLLKKNAESMGISDKDTTIEIIEESSFNMIKGFSTKGKNIRIRAQIKPGLIYKLKGGFKNDEG